MLWWRIVGFTDQVLHQKIDMEQQQHEVELCNREVCKIIQSNGSDDSMVETVVSNDQQDLFKLVNLVS